MTRGRRRPGAESPAPAPKPVSLLRYAALSIAAALVTISLKTWSWWLTGSVSLMSDALESVVNLFAALVVLVALMVATRPPDDRHHFGHGKAEYFSSGLEGALIIVAACGITYAAWERWQHPQALQALDLGLAVSAVAGLINFGVARVLIRVGRRHRSITLEADGRHLLTDVWTTAGVLVGLGAVLATGWAWLDPLLACLVALNILWSGFELMYRSASGLLDATLPIAENALIDAVIARYRQRGVQFHDLRTRQSGVHRFMTVHVLVPGEMTVKQGHDLLEAIEDEIRAILPGIQILTHLEPLEDPASFVHGQPEQAVDVGRMVLNSDAVRAPSRR